MFMKILKIILFIILSFLLMWLIVWMYTMFSVQKANKKSIEKARARFYEQKIYDKIGRIENVYESDCMYSVYLVNQNDFSIHIDFCKNKFWRNTLAVGDSIMKSVNTNEITVKKNDGRIIKGSLIINY
jgi:hypothetical protein